METETPEKGPAPKASPIRTWGPLVAIVALMGLVFAMGWHEYLALEHLGRNYASLNAFISDNLMVALLAYAVLYIAVVALSLPGALALTLAGGLLFGWQIGGPVTVVAATIGATIIFLVAIQLPPQYSMVSRALLHDVGQLGREGLDPTEPRFAARFAAAGATARVEGFPHSTSRSGMSRSSATPREPFSRRISSPLRWGRRTAKASRGSSGWRERPAQPANSTAAPTMHIIFFRSRIWIKRVKKLIYPIQAVGPRIPNSAHQVFLIRNPKSKPILSVLQPLPHTVPWSFQ